MARLSYSERKSLPKSDFAVPSKRKGGKGGYPVPDKAHARAALQRASQFGSPAVKAAVKRKVHEKYPSMEISGMKKDSMPRGKRPSESLNERGHWESHGKGEVTHSMMHSDAMDHGGSHDHMVGRDGKADGHADGI